MILHFNFQCIAIYLVFSLTCLIKFEISKCFHLKSRFPLQHIKYPQSTDKYVIPSLPRNSHLILSAIATKSSLQTRTDITSDGEIYKEVLTSGQGKVVETGDILAVEYSAKVVGETKPFAVGNQEKFVLKDGSMIKGWDIGVGSMKVGERAKIVVSSKYGYGSKGVEPVIPKDASLELDVKILAWLGNQLSPETLFQKDLDIDPFIASTPEAIQQEFDQKKVCLLTLL